MKFEISIIIVIIAIVNVTSSMTHVTSKGIVAYDKLQTLDWLANLFK